MEQNTLIFPTLSRYTLLSYFHGTWSGHCHSSLTNPACCMKNRCRNWEAPPFPSSVLALHEFPLFHWSVSVLDPTLLPFGCFFFTTTLLVKQTHVWRCRCSCSACLSCVVGGRRLRGSNRFGAASAASPHVRWWDSLVSSGRSSCLRWCPLSNCSFLPG